MPGPAPADPFTWCGGGQLGQTSHMSPPIVVEVTRGHVVESRHEVDAAVVGLDGHRSGFGHPDRGVLARSAIKPIQAFPLLATGAADAFGLDDRRLALSCASHGGEPGHVAEVGRWLTEIGLGVEALECGAHAPSYRPAADDLLSGGEGLDARHSNCSGKHSGFLSVCRHLDLDPQGYIRPDHPVQAGHVTKAIEAACEVSLADGTPVVDGCGIPVWELRLDALAGGWARLTGTEEGRRLYRAMAAEPFFVAGTGRMSTLIMEAGGGAVSVKGGAEGVFCGVHPASGVGWAVKARDGAQRAAEAAVLWLMDDLGFGVEVELEPIRNVAGRVVGELRVAG